MPTINITSVDPRQEAIDLAQQTISAIRNIPTDAPVYANQPTFSEFLKLIE